MISVEQAKGVPKFSLKGFEVDAIVTKVYDGDTVHAVFAIEEQAYFRWSCRLAGINTPELRSPDLEERDLAEKAKVALAEKVLYQQVRIRLGKFEKYGRLLATIYLKDKNINEWLISEGYAKPYM